MTLKWEFKHLADFLYVKTSGKDDSFEDTLSYSDAILAEAVKHKKNKILCDERNVTYNLSVLDNFKLAKAVSEIAPKITRLAIVYNENFTDDMDFFQTVAFNRGLTIKTTTSIREAEEWLLK